MWMSGQFCVEKWWRHVGKTDDPRPTKAVTKCLPQCQPQVLKGQCQKIFCFRFFYESSSPKALKIALGSFQIIFTEILASQGAPVVSTTPVTNLPTVSTTVAVYFASGNADVLDTGGKSLVASCHRYKLHWQ